MVSILNPKVSIIILNWNGLEHTMKCISAIQKLTYDNYDIIVVDNGSTDGSQDFLRKNIPGINLIENSRNLGYSEGFNVGINYSFNNGSDYVLVINNDTIIDKKALTELVKVAETDRNIGFVSGKVLDYYRPDMLQSVGRRTDHYLLIGEHLGSHEDDVGQYDSNRDLDFIDDVFLLVSHEVFDTVGSYDKNFFLYFEEADWCVRVRNAGFRIVYAHNARVWHKGGMSSGSGGQNPINTFWLARNWYVFMWRNGTAIQKISFILVVLLKRIPTTFISKVAQGKIFLFTSYIRGNISGIKWIISR